MPIPILLSPEALSFWNSPRREEREPFRASVVAEAHLRATRTGQAVEFYADLQAEPLEVVHPCMELEPCPGCSSSPCRCHTRGPSRETLNRARFIASQHGEEID